MELFRILEVLAPTMLGDIVIISVINQLFGYIKMLLQLQE
jgi:hypothetical protein